MQDYKPVSTPLHVNYKVSSGLCPNNEAKMMEMFRVSYASIVGSLMYAMIYTRPEITQVVGLVSRQIWVKRIGMLLRQFLGMLKESQVLHYVLEDHNLLLRVC